MTGDPRSGDSRDVFISYAHADGEWVNALAENLHRAGLKVFFDKWDIGLGDVIVHQIDKGLRESLNGLLVVSPTSLSRPYVQAEYAVLIDRAIMRGQLLIPVLLKDAAMPPLLATRLYADFRNADGPDYQTEFNKLVRALKGERPGPPPTLPTGSGFKIAGTQSLRLTITQARTSLSGDGIEASGLPPAADFDFDELLWRLKRARTYRGPQRDAATPATGRDALEPVLCELGGKLADVFLPPAVTALLNSAIAEAERLNGTFQLALDIAETFADLPWETLRLGNTVLALDPHVELFRRIDAQGPAPAISIPGPLRILVAIGSPDAQNAGGELLDMEAELRRILDATEKPRRAGKAFVHILEQGGTAAIHEALTERRYHVLHISCHAAPGTLILETSDGAEDRVTAKRLCDEAIPASRATPLIVLAGCSTGQDDKAADGDEADKLPGLARTLVRRGVPAVIAMQAPVGDHYATDLMAEVYEALANWQKPHPLAALGHARRVIERKRRDDTSASPPPPEWPTAAFFCAASPTDLFDPNAEPEKLEEIPTPVFDPGVVVRRVGDMVGRRREQRLILRALRDPGGAGVLIHGIGGVGKSTLAAQILHRLTTGDNFLLISLSGKTDPDQVLGAIGTRLLQIDNALGENETASLHRLATTLRNPQQSWHDRFDFLPQGLLARTPVAFLFDNFEDNLTEGTVPDELAALLTRWLRAPHLSRLVFTCRHPFALPDDLQERLDKFHPGPLSWAETRKLFWRLKGLKALSPKDQRQAYESIGGHPRALEYLDALLNGGKTPFWKVQAKLRKRLMADGITDTSRWCADTIGGLDAALAETVTLAADDILLDQLLAQLAEDPLARQLLIGASVYRVPVDELGLVWPVGDPVEQVPDPERAARLQAAFDRLNETRKKNPAASLSDVIGSESELEQFRRDWAAEHGPPLSAPAGFASAKRRLLDLSLLAPVRFADTDEEMFSVHRWTADALEKRATTEERSAAHQSAAAYWRWRVDNKQQSRARDIEDFLEARHHLHGLGDLEAVFSTSGNVILQLQTWGAWEWEDRLIRETLAWMPVGSQKAAALLHHLGMVAQRRGDYEAALDWYRQSLAIEEQLGNRAGMAGSYHQLGMVAQDKGDYEAALDWYRQSLAIDEQLGNRAGMASTLSQIGILHTETKQVTEAVPFNLQSLALRLQMRSPEIRINLHWLSRQRQELGSDKFLAIVAQHHDAEGTAQISALLDEFARQASEAGPLRSERPPA